ncbi:MAG TPA: sulfatase-like hydrolase/transferase, partial [Flavisolibacter sp.]
LQLFKYLNILFLVLIVTDVIFMATKFSSNTRDKVDEIAVVDCAECPRPNIYLVILDEYAGSGALEELFSFDNSAFENELKARDFRVLAGTRSNYNFTPFSMASIFSMNYLQLGSDKSNDLENQNTCLRIINQNQVISTLKKFDYEFVNLSMFDFAGEPNEVDENEFYSTREKLVTSQTFTGRLQKDLWFHTVLSFKWNWAIRDYQHGLEEQLKEQFEKTASAGISASKPRFVYTHFIMPHYPYLYNEKGQSLPIDKVLNGGKEEYLGFLKYANQFTIDLVDEILKNDKTDPVIIIMSDHGFTKYGPPTDDSYYFQNIVNLRMPSNMLDQVPDSISNVNVFRSVLNVQFGQKMPLLKDSTILLKEY